MVDLSILIPARNEMFLSRTIDDILKHSEADTEVIAVLDGAWADPPVKQHPRVNLIYYPVSIGQRAATNKAASIAQGKYLMKVDAHCSFAQGFDRILLEDMQPDWTQVPIMRNLHAFDWVCEACGERRYQGPSGACTKCGGNVKMDVVWIAKESPQSTSYCFDTEPHFRYFGEFKKRPAGKGDLTETMSLQGSCWMLSREKYFELNVCDEQFGSWGSQGIEVAVKTWLSGGKVIVNHRTYYAHMFRTQGGDFGFPYPLSGGQVVNAKRTARELFFNNQWEKQIRPLSWLVERFWPVPGWTADDLERIKSTASSAKFDNIAVVEDDETRGSEVLSMSADALSAVIYYTCNTHKPEIDNTCRLQLLECGLPIICVSLNKDLDFGDIRIRVDGERSPVMMHRQILAGLQECKAKYAFLCESDVLYHPSHFNFKPRRNDVFYYNTNVWRMRFSDGHFVWTDDLQQVSGCCASTALLLDFYTKRMAQIEAEGFNGHFEPGVKQTVYPRMRHGVYGTENRQSEYPNICIRHDANLTKSKWSADEFRNPQYAEGWKEADEVPFWGKGVDVVRRIHDCI